MSFWKRLFRMVGPATAPPPQPDQVVLLPSILAQLGEDGGITVVAGWPKPASKAAAEKMAENYATLLHLFSTKYVVVNIQQAVATAGERDGMPGVARMVLTALANLQQALTKEDGPDGDQLVVHPTDVFDPVPAGIALNA